MRETVRTSVVVLLFEEVVNVLRTRVETREKGILWWFVGGWLVGGCAIGGELEDCLCSW